MDRTDRLRVMKWGIALQCAGVALALVILGLLVAGRPDPSAQDADTQHMPVGLLVAMIGCGILETMGAMISSVAVKKDWVPTIWANRKSTQLAAINVGMGNIDLACEMFGPLCAGLVLQASGGAGGFAWVGFANIASFVLEALLLLSVLRTNPALETPKPQAAAAAAPAGAAHKGLLFFQSLPLFAAQPSGVPLLILSYALLWFTVLSPHGVVLTAYLQTRDVSPPMLSLFRAAGALSGLAGIQFFHVAGPRLGLRRVCALYLAILAAAVLVAAAVFAAIPTHGHGGHESLGALGWPFLGAIVVSRFGLYGFDTGLLQLEQLHVDEAHRGALGAVESSLCSLGTMSIFLATLFAARHPAEFGLIVFGSALFVAAGAGTYFAWYLLWHEHEHQHGAAASAVTASHAHTTQQRRELDESGQVQKHTHLHFHPPEMCLPKLRHEGGHAHGHGHGH